MIAESFPEKRFYPEIPIKLFFGRNFFEKLKKMKKGRRKKKKRRNGKKKTKEKKTHKENKSTK